jgi:hypothetical protein
MNLKRDKLLIEIRQEMDALCKLMKAKIEDPHLSKNYREQIKGKEMRIRKLSLRWRREVEEDIK